MVFSFKIIVILIKHRSRNALVKSAEEIQSDM